MPISIRAYASFSLSFADIKEFCKDAARKAVEVAIKLFACLEVITRICTLDLCLIGKELCKVGGIAVLAEPGIDILDDGSELGIINISPKAAAPRSAS